MSAAKGLRTPARASGPGGDVPGARRDSGVPLSRDPRLRRGLFILFLLCLAYLFVPFHRVSPAVLAVDIMRDMRLGAPAMGFLASVFFFAYGIMQLPSGLLADSLGPRRTLPLFFALAGGGAVLFGLSESVAGLVIGRGLMGIGVSVVFMCGIKVISRWFPSRAFARVSGIFLGMGGVGLILGSGPMARLCSLVGWRTGLLLSGGAGLAIAVMLRIWVHDTPEELGMPSPPGPGREPGSARVGAAELWASVRTICSSRDFWWIALWFFCLFSINMGYGGLWGGPFLMDVRGLTRSQAGSVLNMMGLGVLAGGPLAGWLSDSVFRARRPVMLLSALALAGLFTLLGAAGEFLPVWSLYVWFFCLAVFGMGSLSVGFVAMQDFFGSCATGTGGGLLNALPSLGVGVFQPLTGWILESQGRNPAGGFTAHAYSLSCLLYLGAALLGLAGAFLVREPLAGTPRD